MELGVQIYGAMEIFRKSPEQFLRKIAEIGYTHIEPCLAFDEPYGRTQNHKIIPAWLPHEIDEFYAIMNTYGLKLSSCHILGNPVKHMDKITRISEKCGPKSFVLNMPQEGMKSKFDQFVNDCVVLESELKKSGLFLWLHNNYREVQNKRGNKSLFELALELCEGRIGAQVDVGWVLFGGEDPIQYMDKIKPYLQSIHYKDIKPYHNTLPPEKAHICLGEGVLNVEAIYRYISTLNVTQLVDQDKSDNNLMEDLKTSAKLLNKIAL